jgi:hypothetical protein
MSSKSVSSDRNSPLWVQRAYVERLSPFSLDNHPQQGRPFTMRFPIVTRKTTPSSLQWMLRGILLIARPPLLCLDARGLRYPRRWATPPSQSGVAAARNTPRPWEYSSDRNTPHARGTLLGHEEHSLSARNTPRPTGNLPASEEHSSRARNSPRPRGVPLRSREDSSDPRHNPGRDPLANSISLTRSGEPDNVFGREARRKFSSASAVRN